MKNFRASGKYYEYKALDFLKQNGFFALRIPVSGAGKQPLPDIIAVRGNTIYPIEVKSTSKNRIVIDDFQINKLFEFCKILSFCNCKPAILVFFKKYNNVILQEVYRNERTEIYFKK